MDNHPLPYTLPGRMLLLACILIPIAGTFGTIYLLAESLPSGRYPLFFLGAPYLIGAVLLFFIGCYVLRKLKIPVRKDDVIGPDGTVRALPPTPTHSEHEVGAAPPSTAYCSNCERDVEIDDDDRCVHCRWPI